MNTFSMDMPSYSRIMWTSLHVKNKWESKYHKAISLYDKLDNLSISHGIRKCKKITIHSEEIVSLIYKLSEIGLNFLPIQKLPYQTKIIRPDLPHQLIKEDIWDGVICKNEEDGQEFANEILVDNPNMIKLYMMQGYPECCAKFKVEMEQNGFIDPIWQQSKNTKSSHFKKNSEFQIRLKDNLPVESNIFLQYENLKLIHHTPCSHDCEHTHKIAKDNLQLAKDLHLDGTDEMLEFLSLPAEWDVLKGVAYISTPIFKIETNSVACYPKHIVQREGKLFPSEAPKGLKFPWNEYLKKDIVIK